MPIDPTSIKAISFDCYGTLIDWETGIAAALGRVFSTHGVPFDRNAVIASFARHEREVEAGRYMRYAGVLGEVMRRIAQEFDVPLKSLESTALADSIMHWPAFAETPGCLRALQKRFKLAIVSNIDDDLFQDSALSLGVQISVVVTAEQVRSYKPGKAHFEELLRRLALPAHQVAHVAESRYHDIAPAKAMGFSTVWVNRHAASATPSASGGSGGTGGTGGSEVQADLEVLSLRELCEAFDV